MNDAQPHLYPLTSPQREIWFDQILHEGTPLYNIGGYVKIPGAINPVLFEQAVNLLVQKHDTLRTLLTEVTDEDGVPMQTYADKLTVTVPVQDFSAQAHPHEAAMMWMQQRFIEIFELTGQPLFRYDLVKISEQCYYWLLQYHHLIIDGYGVALLNRSLAEIYTQLANGQVPNLDSHSYVTFVDNDRTYVESAVFDKQRQYWLSKYPTPPEPLFNPRYRSNYTDKLIGSGCEVLYLPRDFYNRLNVLAKQHKATLFHLLLGAFYVYFTRTAGRDDFAIGLPVLNRANANFKQTAGLFTGVSPTLFNFGKDLSFAELLQQINKTLKANYRHQRFPVSEINRSIGLEQYNSQLFDISLAYLNHDHDALFNEAHGHTIQLFNGYEQTPLLISVEEFHEQCDVKFDFVYNYAYFNADDIKALQARFVTILEAVLKDSASPIHTLPIMTEQEVQQLQTWNDTTTDYPAEQTIVDLFEQQVEKTPDNIAVVFEEQQLSYSELNRKANQLAHYLLNLKNGTDNSLIAIAVERSFAMVIGLLAILKTGGAYVPIDPSYPAARIRYMLEDSRAKLLLTQSHLKAQLSLDELECVVVCLDKLDLVNQPFVNPSVSRRATDLAYVIYTSGSTGKPKGVMIEHQALLNHMRWMQSRFAFTAEDKILQKTPFSFDASVWEFYASLLTGGALVLAKPQGHADINYLFSLLSQKQITVLQLVPSLLKAMLEKNDTIPNSLRYLFCGGEALSQEIQRNFYSQIRNAGFYNLYGPTEACIDATCWESSQLADIRIGQPIANTSIYILDAQLRLLPPGIHGELCIAGRGLARGYLNRPELTAEKFIEVELFGKTERIYKTGDLARWLPDGNLEYLGRLDHQIKLRGFRIELGEIETVINQHPAVKEAVVTLYEVDDNKRLVAYVTVKSEKLKVKNEESGESLFTFHSSLFTQLKDTLKASLPDYMVPSHFTVLDKLPLTPNGKIDRKALPAPDSTPNQNTILIKPQTQIEQQIAEIWQEVLKLEQVGIQDNFFDLGGHSLLLIQVQNSLQTLLKESLPIVKLFQYPTIQSLAAYLTRDEPATNKSKTPNQLRSDDSRDIAIIGMSGRFPGAPDIERFWNNLREGLESIQFFSDEEVLKNGIEPSLLNNQDYVKAGGVLDNAELFDAAFFGYTPADAEILDPQQRLFLEMAWTAIEHAGYDVARIQFPVGVFAGVGINTYLINNLISNQRALEKLGHYQLMLSSDKDFIATRTAYQLNLKGPALTIQTACSTSLVAIHVASQSLLNGECEMALAGGVSVSFPQRQGYLYQEGMIASPDGHCRAFDASAQGTVGGAGVGVVVLKRLRRALDDGDTIHAVIKGSAINNDGMNKVGFTAPSVEGQASVITEAMRGLDYESISYIEAHGTGTRLGDPIEISALTQAYRLQTQKTGYCALGSVKTNVGHLDTAAGVTGLIKTVLALKHREIPPSLHFKKPNPQIDFANSPFFVNTELRMWQSPTPLRAGISSFGIGGTNAHVVVEEAPVQTSSQSNSQQILCLSAKTEAALKQTCHNLADHLTEQPELKLADVAYTLNLGRQAFNHRGFLVCKNLSEAAERLRHQGDWRYRQAGDRTPQVVFMFPGQGTQYTNMALTLYQNEPVFRTHVDECAQLLKPHLGLDLRERLYVTDETKGDLEPTQWAQPALFVTEYALAKLCLNWGIEPIAMIGHSIGEYVAACLAGVFSLADALQLVAIRGQLMQVLPPGEMLSLSLPKDTVETLLTADLSLAAHNAPNLCVVSGPVNATETLIQTLESQQIESRRLHTSHAFHSPMMEAMLPAFRQQLQKLSLKPPQRAYISNLTGTLITSAQATSIDYWCDHLLNPVRFSEGIQTLLKQASDLIFLEIGPGRALSTLARQHQSPSAVMAFNTLRPAMSSQDDRTFLLNTLGQLWLNNVKLDWPAVYANEQRLRIPLPTYPFEQQRYWIDPIPSTTPAIPEQNVKRPLDEWFYFPSWKCSAPLALQPNTKPLNLSNWLIFKDKQGLGVELKQALEKQGGHIIEVQIGKAFEQHHVQSYTLNPQQREDYQSLFEVLRKTEQLPEAVLHLWSLDTNHELEQSQMVGFYSLLFLAQTWPRIDQDRYLFVVSNQIHAVTGAEELQPMVATLLGPVQTIGSEYPDIHCRNIDIVRPSSDSDIHQQVIQLLAECQTTNTERLVAYRHKQRWIRTFESIRFPAANPKMVLRHQGVYLITGGLGGIGLSLATYLAETVQAKLILIGRSALPDAQAWDDWLNTHTEDDATAIKIRGLRKIQNQGSEILVLQADVSRREQMQIAIEQGQARFGIIHGVIHAAGVSKDGIIEIKTTTETALVLSPKVQGTLFLTQLLETQQLDFLIFCSSLSALMEIHGRVDYCSANAFLDAYAQALCTQGVNATSINWDGWQEVGMAVNMMNFKDGKKADLQVPQAIKPAEGVEALARILSHPMPQILLSTTDWQQRLQQQNHDLQLQKNEWLKKKDMTGSSQHNRPALTTEYVAPRNLIEQQITNIWQLLLGIEPIGIYDNFLELGGHSLLMTQLISSLHQTFSVKLPMQTLFESSTIAKLAEEIDHIQTIRQQLQTTTGQPNNKLEEIEL